MAKECLIQKAKRTPKIQRSRLQPLPALRASPWLHAEVQYLPYLLPRTGAPGIDPRRHQIVLVEPHQTISRPVLKKLARLMGEQIYAGQ